MPLPVHKIDKSLLTGRLLFRENFSHKGDYGHLCLVCGCDSMPGAAVLATGAALKSGCGLVTLHSTRIASVAAMCQFPSAMLSIDPLDAFSSVPACLDKFTCIGVGPGLGMRPATVDAFAELLRKAGSIPMVLDADALNATRYFSYASANARRILCPTLSACFTLFCL